jgi:hypothetical protein
MAEILAEDLDCSARFSGKASLRGRISDFILPHLGSFMDDWGAHARVIEQIVRYPNVYADTSAVRRFDYIVEAVRRAGPQKLIFGSDGPWLHPGVELRSQIIDSYEEHGLGRQRCQPSSISFRREN